MVRNQIIDHRTITRINELTKKHFSAAKENVKANEKPETFDFGEAIRRMKKGGCVSRRKWSYGTYIQIACDINYTTPKNTTNNTQNPAIVYVGYRGTEMGWMPRNADMMAEDWYELKED
jgi:hypothetical protein